MHFCFTLLGFFIEVGWHRAGRCRCCCKCPNQGDSKGSATIMSTFRLDATHDPVPFSLDIQGIKDKEDNDVPRSEVVAVLEATGQMTDSTYDDATNQGTYVFGGVGAGLCTYKVVDKDDPSQELARSSDAFDLFAGDPDTVASVTAVSELVPEPETPPVE